MPELPDVEVRRLCLERTSLDKPIERVAVPEKRILENTSPTGLGRGLKNGAFISTLRRGKYLLVRTSLDNTLLMHFGMSGDLFYRYKGVRKPKWSRVEFYFFGGDCLHYISLRLLGKVALYPTTDVTEIPDIAKLGPEPLDRSFTFKKFSQIVSGHKTTIHQVLMDQHLIAGIGNLYSDEITYQAGVRPDRKASGLSGIELRRLYDCMKRVLRRSIELDAELGDYPDKFLIPHREKGGECPLGHARLIRKTIGGRSSYYCPKCQK